MSDNKHIVEINGTKIEVDWYLEPRHCDYCGKDFLHNGYNRDCKFHFVKSDETKQCCDDCLKSINKFNIYKNLKSFVNHIPTFVDGGTYVHQMFETDEEVLEWLRQKFVYESKDKRILACDGNDCVMTVYIHNNRISWCVHGYVDNIDLRQYLPQWQDVVESFKEQGYESKY